MENRHSIRSSYAFTLIEILVTVFIIAFIATVVMASFSNVRLKSRDSKRVSHLNTIHQALQSYYNDHKSYPTILDFDQPLKNAEGTKTYLDTIPTNPIPRTDHNCPDNEYTYVAGENQQSYSLSVCVGASDPDKSQLLYSQPDGVFHCGDRVTDKDGYEYGSVTIGNQCWMSQNLKTKTYPNGTCINGSAAPCSTASVADNGKDRACYNNSEANCLATGAYYTWYGAMNIAGDGANIGFNKPMPDPYTVWINHQGICPNGWHIPTPDDFTTLMRTVCATGTDDCSVFAYGTAATGVFQGTYEGTKLNSGPLGFNWGLNGMISGTGDVPPYISQSSGTWGYLWGAAFNGIISNQAFRTLIGSPPAGVERKYTYRPRLYPVRCLKN